MTTNATPTVKTAEEPKKVETTPSAKTAPSTLNATKPLGSDKLKQPETKPAAVVTAPVAKPPVKEEAAPEEKLTFHKEKFADYKLVRLYLLEEGCIQYDPAFPELVLNTADKRGKILPLTPFFKSRIGITLDIVL